MESNHHFDRALFLQSLLSPSNARYRRAQKYLLLDVFDPESPGLPRYLKCISLMHKDIQQTLRASISYLTATVNKMEHVVEVESTTSGYS